MRMRTRHSIQLLLLVILTMTITGVANATMQLTLTTGTHTVTCTSSGLQPAGCLIDFAGAGTITFGGVLGTWNINTSTGAGNHATASLMDVVSLNGTATGGPNLAISFSDDTTTPVAAGYTGHIGGTQDAGFTGVRYQAFWDTSLGGMAHQIFDTGVVSGSPFGASKTGVCPGPCAGTPFALTQVLTLSSDANGSASFNANLNAVPEPASIVFLGTVLLGVTTIIRKKRTV